MSTYEELSLIISIALLVVAILNYTHKNSRPALTKLTTISYSFLSCTGAGEVQSPSGYPVKYIIANVP